MYSVKSRSAMIKHDETPFALQQSNIDKHIKNKLNYFKNVQKQLDAQATKAASIALYLLASLTAPVSCRLILRDKTNAECKNKLWGIMTAPIKPTAD